MPSSLQAFMGELREEVNDWPGAVDASTSGKRQSNWQVVRMKESYKEVLSKTWAG